MKNLNENIHTQANTTEKKALSTDKLTFKELKELIPPTGGKKLPTRKQLKESGYRIFMERRIDEYTDLTVYENGFVLYEKQTGENEITTTVFGADRCGSVAYDSVGRIDDLQEKDFENEDGVIRLVIEGENRIEHNREKVHNSKKSFAINGDGSDWSVADRPFYTLDEEERERYKRVRESMDKLTDRQREVVTMYVVKGMKQQEIADKLGISQPTVKITLSRGLENLRNVFVKYKVHKKGSKKCIALSALFNI